MDSFARLLLDQIPRLRRYARALAGNVADADDLVQDCLERALSRARLWRGDGELRPWLFTIMHNLYVNRVRRQVRGPQFQPLELGEDPPDPDHWHGESELRLEELQAGLDALRPEQREVLLLVALEGMSYEEVAQVLEIPLGTVMSRLFRAREHLRRLVGQETTGLRRVK